MLLLLMIKALHCNAKRAFPKELLNFVSVAYVVLNDNFIVSFVIIKAKVMFILVRPFDLSCSLAYVIDLRVVKYLCLLIIGELIFEVL